jgi:anti-anti-sigma factor
MGVGPRRLTSQPRDSSRVLGDGGMVSVFVVGGWALLTLGGEFDLANASEIEAVGAQLVEQGITDLTIDLSDVSFMDVAGGEAVLHVQSLMKRVGGRLVLIGASPSTQRMFNLSGLSKVLTLSRLPQRQTVPSETDTPVRRNLISVDRCDDRDVTDDADKVAGRLLDSLRHLLLSESTIAEVLRRVALAAVQIVPGATSASISVFARDELRSAAVSDATAIDADVAQYVTNEGPCLYAARKRQLVHFDARADNSRFGHFAPLALEAGVRAAVSVPVSTTDRTIGSLNVYSTFGFGPSADTKATIIAALAAAALTKTKSKT